MKTPISSMMQRSVWTASMDDSIEVVERLVADKGLSWVPVQDPGGAIVGVISASDLLQFHATRRDAKQVCAWELCTYKPVTVTPDADASSVASMMATHGIHHVVVMEGGLLQGVVSSLDFVRRFAAEGAAAPDQESGN